jgi:hypothetical protein
VTTKITSDLDDPTVFEDSSSQVSVFSVSALPKSTFPRNTTSAIYSILTLPFSAVFTAKAISLQFKFKNPIHSSNHEKLRRTRKLIRRDSLLVFDLLLHIFDGITGFRVERDCLSGQCFDEDLHAARLRFGSENESEEYGEKPNEV